MSVAEMDPDLDKAVQAYNLGYRAAEVLRDRKPGWRKEFDRINKIAAKVGVKIDVTARQLEDLKLKELL